jgi:microcystin-dependent protein
MANLTESSTYEAGIYQLETSDPCLAGPSGVLNTPHKQLANRTKFLKDAVDVLAAAGTTEATARAAADTLINTELRLWREVVSISETGGVIPLAYADVKGTIYRVGSTSEGEADYSLPLANTCPAGTTVAFKHEGSSATNHVNIRRSGSNNIIHKGINVTILVMRIGDACVLVSNGVDRWNIVSYFEASIGLITTFGMTSLPTGYLECNGAAISRTTYANLFNVIGTTFGVGDGSSTFNLPDLRGEFVRGWDNSRGVDSGRAFGSAQGDLVKAHTHDIVAAVAAVSTTDMVTGTADGTTAGAVTASTSANVGAENRPRNVALIYGIRF